MDKCTRCNTPTPASGLYVTILRDVTLCAQCADLTELPPHARTTLAQWRAGKQPDAPARE